jgi:hypothetical protein
VDVRNRRVFLGLLLVLLWASPLLGQSPPTSLGLLVVVPEKIPLDALEVDRWMDLLKIERERQRLTPEELPLLRLSMGRAQHRAVLEKLGLQSADRVRTFTCRRDAGGWPSEVIAEHEAGTSPDHILARLVKQKDAPLDLAAGPTLGLLLVGNEQTAAITKPFLEELGRFWLHRYGRMRPSPYPLASYDVGQQQTVEALRKVFPQLTNGKYPVVALCAFDQGQPVEVLQVFRGVDTPASLVREISAARGQALAAGARPVASAPATPLPGAHALGLSDQQEHVLLVSRLNETAQQLWSNAKDDKSLRNQGPKRILLRVIEDSRRFAGGDPAALGLLLESLRDYKVEPLKLERNSKVSEQSVRFNELVQALLESP